MQIVIQGRVYIIVINGSDEIQLMFRIKTCVLDDGLRS